MTNAPKIVYLSQTDNPASLEPQTTSAKPANPNYTFTEKPINFNTKVSIESAEIPKEDEIKFYKKVLKTNLI